MNCKQNLFPTKWTMALSLAVLMLAGSVLAVGQTENVIYRFQGGKDGLVPYGGLISDQAGNFYGTTEGAGAHGYGTVFQLSQVGGHWTEAVLYAFCALSNCSDGGKPFGELILDQAGNLYGITLLGGSVGGGTVFELTPQGSTWTETVIYNFPSNIQPAHGLVFDEAEDLYGAMCNGGVYGAGAVFQLTPGQGGWTAALIHSFTGHDGSCPVSGPIINVGGNLYGSFSGTSNTGGVYELKAPLTQGDAWIERVLYGFKGGNDGANPSGRLVFDQKGNLYGVTRQGGTSKGGTVFQLVRQGVSWTEAVIYSFCSQPHCSDGKDPRAGVIVDGKGNLYGTTYFGGNGGDCGTFANECGTVFQLTPPASQGGAWTETVLHNFNNTGGDGNLPEFGLIHGKFGSLWGTTPEGGKTVGPCAANGGCGTVFRVFP
jgi:uncharacterized repeat protein (TIGR03803 family)